ncbi:hypothetical protein MSG28_009912 [Choristoneura fumiferana]|uniref:Uncharacterized protein n=1 Tax=Choristoneura fumiferana TaxID=7141 RepID=A0ACC0JD39_CHOFU|nr:hypothetical protein MSG28_009912 [Choristoneura fumiferana]
MPRCSKRTRSGAGAGAGAGDVAGAAGVPGATAIHHHHQQHKRSRNTSSRRHSKAEDTSFSAKKCIAWFKEYTTVSEPDVLGPEGMEKFCEDIGVDPENVVMLVIAYKMGAKQMGYFTQEEWVKGLTELQCDSVHKLQTKLDHLRSLLNDPYVFKAVYRYSYDFARDKEQRSLDTATARALLGVLLPRWALRPALAEFLAREGLARRYRVVNRDQWCNILEFSRTVDTQLVHYDADGACQARNARRIRRMAASGARRGRGDAARQLSSAAATALRRAAAAGSQSRRPPAPPQPITEPPLTNAARVGTRDIRYRIFEASFCM